MTDLPDLFTPRMPVGIPPEVCAEFERIAQTLIDRGHHHYSADSILHVVRYHRATNQGAKPFKCNNNWTAPLARWWLKRHPEFPRFFELRERIGDSYREAAE